MKTNTQEILSANEQLDLVRWLIERVDGLRSSASNRAAIVISADAIFLTGATFLLDKFLSLSRNNSLPARIMFLGSMMLGIVFLILSIINATNAIAFVWKTSKQALASQSLPDFLFFRPRDTEMALPDLDSFRAEFSRSTKEQMIGYALGELYIAGRVHTKRYKNLRQSIRLLIIAVFSISLSIVSFLVQSLWSTMQIR